jgi:hypothetical protein
MVYNYIVVQVLGVPRPFPSRTNKRTPMTRFMFIAIVIAAASLMLGGCASGHKESLFHFDKSGKMIEGEETMPIKEDGKTVQLSKRYLPDGSVWEEKKPARNPLAGFININIGSACDPDPYYNGTGLWVPGGGGLDCLTYPAPGCDTQVKSGDFGGKKCN